MLRALLNNSSGDFALSRFATANTWPAAQTFSVAATFSAGLTSTGLLQSTSSSTTVGGVLSRANGTISANPAGIANTAFQAIGAEAVVGYSIFDAAASNAQVLLRRRNGTYASQTAIASGNNLGSVAWQGFGASTFGTVPAAEIRGVAQQAFTEAARGTSLEFYTTATGTITQQLTLTISPTLVFAPVDMSATGFNLTKAAGNNRLIQFQTSSSNRWALIANATAEGVSNAGSDFEIRRYSDAGADLGAVISINRANGGTIFANNVTFSTQASVDGAAGTNRLLLFRTSGSTRWAIFADNGAETGTGNAGSFLNIARYSDAGAFLDNPILISRSTGKVTFAGNAINIATTQSPASSGAAGATAGDIAWDDTYLYVRMSTGWRRIALGAAF